MSDKKNIKLHILGGGPAGLAAGYFAKKKKIELKIFEASNQTGGNCKTIKYGEYRFDTGAHRFHDKNDEVTSEIKSLVGEDFLKVAVPSKIFKNRTLIDFPLNSLNLCKNLEFSTLSNIVYENIVNRFRNFDSPNNFKELANIRYGKTLSNLFLLNYTKKLWGQDPTKLATSISGNRLKNLDLSTFLKEIFFNSNEHLDGSFYYPKYGFGTIFDQMKEYIGSENVKLNAPVNRLTHDGKEIKEIVYRKEKVSKVNKVINSLPINILINILDPLPPKEIIEIVDSINYRNLRLCIIYLDVPYFSKNASIYFPEKIFPFTRIYEPKNRSRMMAPLDKTCIVVEIPYSNNDETHLKSNNKLFQDISSSLISSRLIKKNNIIDHTFFTIDYAYPVLELDTEDKLIPVFNYLSKFNNIYHIGRGAEFKYIHTHEIIHQSSLLIDKIS